VSPSASTNRLSPSNSERLRYLHLQMAN
jgi:hypothetical protein